MHACSRSSCGGENGLRTPIFGAILGFFWPRKYGKGACFHALNTGRCSRLHLRCGVSPSRHTHKRHKHMSHQTRNSWILAVGVVE